MYFYKFTFLSEELVYKPTRISGTKTMYVRMYVCTYPHVFFV